jgi:hypothetical protein
MNVKELREQLAALPPEADEAIIIVDWSEASYIKWYGPGEMFDDEVTGRVEIN